VDSDDWPPPQSLDTWQIDNLLMELKQRDKQSREKVI
jgi:hypothetical protein